MVIQRSAPGACRGIPGRSLEFHGLEKRRVGAIVVSDGPLCGS